LIRKYVAFFRWLLPVCHLSVSPSVYLMHPAKTVWRGSLMRFYLALINFALKLNGCQTPAARDGDRDLLVGTFG